MVDLGLINGKRERHSFQTKADAETFAEVKRTERINEGTAALGLSQEIRQDAAKAAAVLSPYGVSLLEAARYYAKHVLAYKTAPPLADIVKRLIADAEKNDRRDRTIDAFGDQMKTAAQMGHRDSSVIHNHYKALVLKAEAEKYWKLSPEVVEKEDQENDPKAKDPAEVKPKAIHKGGGNPAPESPTPTRPAA